MEAETRLMGPQVKETEECQRPPEAGGAKEGFIPTAQGSTQQNERHINPENMCKICKL